MFSSAPLESSSRPVDENGTKKGAILSSTLSPPGGSSSSSCETSFGKSIAPAITATKLEQISLAEKEEDEDEETENRMMCYSEEEEEERRRDDGGRRRTRKIWRRIYLL